MKPDKEALKYNTAGMMILAVILLTDRFWYSMPDWLVYIFALTAAVLIGTGLYKGVKNSRQER